MIGIEDAVASQDETVFRLSPANAVDYLVSRGLLHAGAVAHATELTGGVSASVVAVRGPGVNLAVKQALPQLRVEREWLAKQERTQTEAAAMRLCGRLTPGRVPALVDINSETHVMVMELLPTDARNWQAEVAAGRAHSSVGRWAGETLGIWHAQTAGDPAVADAFADFEAFEQQRLDPFFETLLEELPDLEAEVAPLLAELRERRTCFVDGDYAMKNTLVGPSGHWVIDFEVAHYGNPVFDLGFFLSFVVLSAVRWPRLTGRMQYLAAAFLEGYEAQAGPGFAGDAASVTAHTGCLVLARTDGKSPALFLDELSRDRARWVGIELLRHPERGLWSWA